jgi:transposase
MDDTCPKCRKPLRLAVIEPHATRRDLAVHKFDCARTVTLQPGSGSYRGKIRPAAKKLGPISKRGDQYLRRILVVGAHAVLKRARHQPEKYPWVTRLLERKPFRVVAVAVANKMARVAWALLTRRGSYRAPVFAAAA